MTQSQAINLLLKVFTNIGELSELDLERSSKAIYFIWRSVPYKFDIDYIRVDEVNGQLLTATDTAELMTRLLKLKHSITG
jgi:hypothetical protein